MAVTLTILIFFCTLIFWIFVSKILQHWSIFQNGPRDVAMWQCSLHCDFLKTYINFGINMNNIIYANADDYSLAHSLLDCVLIVFNRSTISWSKWLSSINAVSSSVMLHVLKLMMMALAMFWHSFVLIVTNVARRHCSSQRHKHRQATIIALVGLQTTHGTLNYRSMNTLMRGGNVRNCC